MTDMTGLDKLAQLAFRFRGTRSEVERQEIADEYAQVWETIKGGDEVPTPEEQLPYKWMPKAKVDVIVTDMGNGGAFCSKCGCNLDHGDPQNEIPSTCPECYRTFEGTNPPYINMGGSDF